MLIGFCILIVGVTLVLIVDRLLFWDELGKNTMNNTMNNTTTEQHGHIWRTDLSPDEIKEILNALEHARATFHGLAAAFEVSLEGEGNINCKNTKEHLSKVNKVLANTLSKYSVDYK